MEDFTYEALIESYNAQRAERFAYIDFVLRFLGGLNRSDLLDFFGIGEAAASKEISEYKKLTANNVDYDRVLRKNVILRESFKPLINLDAETALGMLANGFNKNKLYNRPMLPYQRIGATPHHLNTDFVSKVTRAIYSQTAIKCNYISDNSKNHDERTLLPTAFFYDGQSWMFRAFHRTPVIGKAHFKCFEFSRLANITECPNDVARSPETLSQDADWHLVVPLQLTLHPSLSSYKKATLTQEFGLGKEQHEFVITEKAVLVYYLKKHWKIDVNDTPSSEGSYNFHLKNGDTLKHLCCMENVFKYP
ncbi:MAG: transcriptional regulator [gamma proteobacterium endosymbiont of Lamellibrachia anaximandri]|nr:transcriptional regulator [gamma proteobacterium endosymbiont of Lamellibrachia anaximandri]MBL3618755.1 transcriptional regulator [gamma proteobacterium endosymbiont of Lamellibrachia anaximandri]